jgi:hypothetical protein
LLKDNFFGVQNIFELKTVIFVALSIEFDFSSQKCLKSSARTKITGEKYSKYHDPVTFLLVNIYFLPNKLYGSLKARLLAKNQL